MNLVGGVTMIPLSRASEPPARRLTRSATVHPATLFVPHSEDETPDTHFPLQTVMHRSTFPRMVNRYNSREILIVVDGACRNNGRVD